MENQEDPCPSRPTLAALAFAAATTASATTYTVTTTADSGAGSLRQAILDANANPGADTIAFGIVGSGVHTIAPASPLPTITGPVTIDGYTQSGSSANTNPASQGLNTVLRIEIDGTNAGAAPCLFAAADDVTIRGLVVNRCTDKAIATTGAHSDFVLEGCFIGTNAAGTQALAPYGGGVNPRSQTNARIGGTTPAARNLVSGDSLFGDHIAFGAGITEPVSNSLVAGNLVGTDITGLHLLVPANGSLSMDTGGGANNVVGGTAAGARNVFAGPVFVSGTGNQIQGNFVGLDVTGTIVIGATSVGITVNTSPATTRSAARPPERATASGERSTRESTSAATATSSRATRSEPTATGTVRLANGYWGIRVGGSNTTIGGVGPGEGNIVAYNRGYAGVVVHGVNATVRGNSIFDNAGIQAEQRPRHRPHRRQPLRAGRQHQRCRRRGRRAERLPELSPDLLGDLRRCEYDDRRNAQQHAVDHLRRRLLLQPRVQRPPAGAGRGQDLHRLDRSHDRRVRQRGLQRGPRGRRRERVADHGHRHEPVRRRPPSFRRASCSRSTRCPDLRRGVIGAQIRGLAFEPGATVTVGGVPATGVVVDNPTTITANIPALPAGSINALTVANPGGGASGTLPNAWISNFNDIPGSQFYTQITSLVANGITAGVGGGNYGINQPTLRQQMAVFLLKAKYGICYTPPPCTGVFDDVPCSSRLRAVDRAARRGRHHGRLRRRQLLPDKPGAARPDGGLHPEGPARRNLRPPALRRGLRRRRVPVPIRRLDRAARGRGRDRRLRRQ